MKKLSFLFFFLAISFFISGYKFPEQLPAPMDFDTYVFEKLKFGQTSTNEFSYFAPTYPQPEIEGKYVIYSEANLNNNYKYLRVGFKDNFLDWVELEFAVPQSLKKIQQNYGKSKQINEKHSNKFNYHDYGFFNIVTDKNNVSAFGITLYDSSGYQPDIAKIVAKLPDYKSLNFINDFIPGRLMENDFNMQYKNFKPEINKNQSQEKIYSIPAKYLKNNDFYSSAELIFNNGILSFVNLTPKNLSTNDIKKIYGETKIIKSEKENIEYLEYSNFIVGYNKKNNKILSIGIINAL